MIKILDYKPEDLENIQLQKCQEIERPSRVTSKAITLVHASGEVLAIFGGNFVGPGIFHIWGLVSDSAKKHIPGFPKACKKALKLLEENWKPRRIQIDIRSDYDIGVRWAGFLKFEYEGRMIKYGVDGIDHFLYSRVK